MNKLAEKRIKKNMTLEGICKELHIPMRTYHSYETGERKIPVAIKNMICEVLGIEAQEENEIFAPSKYELRET